MIESVLLLAPGALGLVALGTRWLPGEWRRRLLTAVVFLGIAAGLGLAARSGSDQSWRSVSVGTEALLVGVAIACAWIVAAVALGREDDPLGFALVGVAATGLALAATAEWSVPALLFWFSSSLALGGLLRRAAGSSPALLVLFASDAGLLVALAFEAVDAGRWTVAEGLEGWPFYVVVAAGALRAGVLPRLATWSSIAASCSPALPLMTGGGFVLVSFALGGADRWAALALLVAGGLSGTWAAARSRASLTIVAAASIALLAACSLVDPDALIPAGLAAVIVATSAAIVPRSPTPEAALPLVPIPPSAAFVAFVLAGAAAVQQAFASDRLTDKIPWALVGALLPLVAAVCLGAAARVGTGLSVAVPQPSPTPPEGARRFVPHGLPAWSRFALRAVVVASAAIALWPAEWLDLDRTTLLTGPRTTILFAVALAAAGLVAWVSLRGARPAEEVDEPGTTSFGVVPFPRRGILARGVSLMAGLLAVGVIGGLGWLTFEGLRVGFLG